MAWIHVNVWQKPLQYCKVISLQLKQTNKQKAKGHQTQALIVSHPNCIFFNLNLFILIGG